MATARSYGKANIYAIQHEFFNLHMGEQVTKQEMLDWIDETYPGIQHNTIFWSECMPSNRRSGHSCTECTRLRGYALSGAGNVAKVVMGAHGFPDSSAPINSAAGINGNGYVAPIAITAPQLHAKAHGVSLERLGGAGNVAKVEMGNHGFPDSSAPINSAVKIDGNGDIAPIATTALEQHAIELGVSPERLAALVESEKARREDERIKRLEQRLNALIQTLGELHPDFCTKFGTAEPNAGPKRTT